MMGRQSVRCRVLQQGRCRQRRRHPSLHWLPALLERHHVWQAHLLHRQPGVERDEAGYEPAAEAKETCSLWALVLRAWRRPIAAKRGLAVLVDKQDEPGDGRIAAVPPAKQELTRVIKVSVPSPGRGRCEDASLVRAFGRGQSVTTPATRSSLAYGAEPTSLRPLCGALSEVMTADDLLGEKLSR